MVVLLVQAMLLLAASRTGGITHWKLTDDTINPGPASSLDLAGKTQTRPSTESEDVYAASQLAATDPEFALLIRYSAKSSGSVSPNRGGRGHGVFRRQGAETHSSSCDYEEDEDEEGDEESAEEHGSARSKLLSCQRDWERKQKPRNPDGSGPM